MSSTKEVHFYLYCPSCKHARGNPAEDPCNDCLDHPYNEDSHKPIHYEEGEKNEKRIFSRENGKPGKKFLGPNCNNCPCKEDI